ncbi:hypothetical protein IP92_00099 [Pseudoduganella flava]|uniref:Uncharacterized protein n=1 Tax=Pseudoduganella flava TaxID=871742 RepID=A0A562Q341_9BURK|nr:hypothetical protein [Pseudoduganella flava]QGZ41185.1 hypothetical protein GO485_20410 [Pseudoduganella flava]TWI51117.1 hypothetical protein IP92_00099 [Pseudoduganella flava]
MISTTTPALWQAMRTLPLACRFGAAPPELRALHRTAVTECADDGARFLGELHAALAALPAALKARVDPLLLGVFYLDGLGTCVVTDVVSGGDGGLVGTLVAIDTAALRDVDCNRPAMRAAAMRYLLEEAFDSVAAGRRGAVAR